MSNYCNFWKAAEDMQGYFIAALTDELRVGVWPMADADYELNEEKVIEIRVFNDQKEIKIFRTDIGKEFSKVRIIDDNDLPEGMEFFSQDQYLDIDTNRSGNVPGYVKTTGGGRYFLPIRRYSDETKVTINYYVTKDRDSGLAKVTDWRVVGFKEV